MPPFTVRATAELTGDGLGLAVRGTAVVIFAGETAATVAAGLVVAISGDTTATGVLLDTDADTSGAVTAETTGVPVTAVALTTPAVVTFGTAADLDSCVDDEGEVDWAAVTLATLTRDCTGVEVEGVAVTVVVVSLIRVELSTAVVFTACTLDAPTVVVTLGVTALVDVNGFDT